LGDKPRALLEVMAALAEEKVNVEVIAALAVLGKVMVVSMVATIRPRAATALDRLAQDGISVCSCYLLADKNQLVFIVDGSERAKPSSACRVGSNREAGRRPRWLP